MSRLCLLDHAAIAARVPHAGPMCLLDQVHAWDEDYLECTAHARPAGRPHPLEEARGLPATAAIEYAAQAMALHGRLIQERAAPANQDGTPRRGFLAALRSVRLHCRWIERSGTTLEIRVVRFAGDDVQVLYDFEVGAGRPIAQGRAVVVLDAGARKEGMK